MKLKFDHYKFNKAISNGVPVLWKRIPWANDFAYLRIMMRVGARHDPMGKEGTAHFLEHLPFDGCNGWPTEKTVKSVSRHLFHNSLNASTNFERTVYTGALGLGDLGRGIDFLTAAITSPLLKLGDIERERKIITREIWRAYQNQSRQDLEKKIRILLYGKQHPWGRQERAFGWVDTVAHITPTDLRNFYDEHYHRGNLQILCVGDLTRANVKQIDRLTQAVSKGVPIPEPPMVKHWPNPEVGELEISARKYFGMKGQSALEEAGITIFRLLPKLRNDATLFLGCRMMSALLFEAIRSEFGGTYTPQVSTTNFRDHTRASIRIGVSPEKIDSIKAIIRRLIDEISGRYIRHRKLFTQVKSTILFHKLHIDISADEITDRSMEELANEGYINTNMDDYREVDRVDYKDVAKLFAEQFRPEQLFCCVLTK